MIRPAGSSTRSSRSLPSRAIWRARKPPWADCASRWRQSLRSSGCPGVSGTLNSRWAAYPSCRLTSRLSSVALWKTCRHWPRSASSKLRRLSSARFQSSSRGWRGRWPGVVRRESTGPTPVDDAGTADLCPGRGFPGSAALLRVVSRQGRGPSRRAGGCRASRPAPVGRRPERLANGAGGTTVGPPGRRWGRR